MNKRERHIVIMAGGIGSRFWPMSTPEYPKQFIDVMGVGKSLLQLTVDRFLPIAGLTNIWIVTSERYVEFVKQQLPGVPSENILAEPEARNTAPCIGYACWKIHQKHPGANIVVAPSDAMIIDVAEFRRVIEEALVFTETSESIVTIGIKPNRPETGYGYISCAPDAKFENLVKVDEFKEKPNLKTAEEYLKAGNYFWNAGIFVWNTDTILNAFKEFVPDLAKIMDKIAVDFYTERESSTLKKLFPTCEKISIDYAVMEKADYIYTIPADFGWSDLGTWGALHVLLPKDESGNSMIGADIKMVDCQNCLVHADQERRVVLEGLDGYIVVEHNSQLLVCRLSEEQYIKEFTTK